MYVLLLLIFWLFDRKGYIYVVRVLVIVEHQIYVVFIAVLLVVIVLKMMLIFLICFMQMTRSLWRPASLTY